MAPVFGPGGWSLGVIPQEMQIYFAGKLIGTVNPVTLNAQVVFEAVVTDRLGSVRVRGSQTMRYFPYGQEMTLTAANGQDKFGTYLRDAATGLDYANQRYYSPGFGRFLTSDPSDTANTSDPGSWSRYAYVQGDPVNFKDPTGEILVAPSGSGGAIPLPITFIAWGIGKLFGFGVSGRMSVDVPWRDDLGGQVAKWDARIAQSEEDAKQSGARYVAALNLTFDCYTRSQFGPHIRRFTYQAIDRFGAPFNRGEYNAYEQHHIVQGQGTLITRGLWGHRQQRAGGSFFDYVGKQYLSKDLLTYQTLRLRRQAVRWRAWPAQCPCTTPITGTSGTV